MVKYVVTGATGGLGSQVLKHLLKLVPSSEIAIVIRDPSKISSEINSSGIQIRTGDFSKPEQLDIAFKDTEKLLIVSVPSIEHEYRVKLHVNAIDAAKRANVKHVYYTSLMFGTDVKGQLVNSVAHVMQAHLDTEAYLAKSGLTYTVLREGLYNDSFPLYTGFFDHTKDNEVCVPGDGSIAWVAIEDLGEATAKIMVKGGYEQKTLLLTGSTAIAISDLAKIFAEILRRPIHFRIISVDEYVERNKHPGTTAPYPTGTEDFLKKWATSFKALENGESACVDPLVQQLLDKEPILMKDTVTKMFTSTSK